MALERQGRGFFQRMSDWINGKQDLAVGMSNERPSYYSPNSRGGNSDYDYYNDDYPVRKSGFGGHHGGGHGGHYGATSDYGGYCQEDQVSIGLLVLSLAGIAVMFYVVLTKIQANGGRRKRESKEDDFFSKFTSFFSFFDTGMLECSLINNVVIA